MEENESITDWLRELIEEHWPHSNPTHREGEMKFAQKLDALADRIDEEMVEPPLSADGHIWTGREECFWTSSEQEGYNSFGCVAIRNGKWYVEDNEGMDYEAESVWYERPDSLERIADELDEWSEDNRGNGDSKVFDRAADYADRIRRLAERKDQR